MLRDTSSDDGETIPTIAKDPYNNTIQIPLNGTRGYYGQGYTNGI